MGPKKESKDTKAKGGGASKDKNQQGSGGAKGKAKGAGGAASEGKDAKVKGAQSINVRHILTEKQSQQQDAIARLQGGEGFDAVARAVSTDKARAGGSLGWKTKGSLLPEFEAVAFGLAVSSTAKPAWGECKTAEGYHVIMVEGRK